MLICYNNVVSLGHNIQVVCPDKACTHSPKTSNDALQEIIMDDCCVQDTSGKDIFEDDSTYNFCVAKSDKTILGLGFNASNKDIVADSLSAVLIAKAAWYPLYGKDNIEKEKPYRVSQSRRYWYVEGTLKEGCEGGTAHIIIRKTDGKVMMVWHEK